MELLSVHCTSHTESKDVDSTIEITIQPSARIDGFSHSKPSSGPPWGRGLEYSIEAHQLKFGSHCTLKSNLVENVKRSVAKGSKHVAWHLKLERYVDLDCFRRAFLAASSFLG